MRWVILTHGMEELMARRKPITFETAVGDDRWKLDVLTADQIRSLPPSMELVYAARALGIGRTLAHDQARGDGHGLRYGDQMVPVQWVGKMWRVRRADVMRVLGMAESATPAATADPAA